MKSKQREASPMKAAAEELQALETAFLESMDSYKERVLQEIGQVRGAVEKVEAAESDPEQGTVRDLRDMLTLLRNFEIKAAKGRRKDLKKVDSLVQELLELSKSWRSGT